MLSRSRANSSGAINAYEEAIRLDPNHHKAWTTWVSFWGAQGRYDEALSAFDRAIEIDPQYTMA